MGKLIDSLKVYINDVLAISVSPKRWEKAGGLPVYLRELYEFYTISMHGADLLLISAKGTAEQTPGNVRKHIKQLRDKWSGDVVYVHPAVIAYNRKRLIENKVPFIIPGNQMYLPMAGIDLRENFRKVQCEVLHFSPATQAVIIFILLKGDSDEYAPSYLARQLGYSLMTMTRVFNELESVEAGEVTVKGKERIFKPGSDKKIFWERTKEYMRNPVNKRLYIKVKDDKALGLVAGLTALSRHSTLTAPDNPIYAIGPAKGRMLGLNNGIRKLPGIEQGACIAEVWSYDPCLLGKDGVVDILSLYLSLRESEDERVEKALKEAMEHLVWLKG